MTTPTRRIRRAQNSVASGLAALDLREARATIRQKDIVLRAVARAGGDAMLAADALRMERDAAHAECARLTGEMERAVRAGYSMAFRWGQLGSLAHGIAARLVQVICEDAERIATLTAERDHARAIAVALEQEEALVRRHCVPVPEVDAFLDEDGRFTVRDAIIRTRTKVRWHRQARHAYGELAPTPERLTALMGVADEADALGAECYRLQDDIDRLTAERDALSANYARAVEMANSSNRVVEALRSALQSAKTDLHTILAERDHARAIAVALEQEDAARYIGNRVPMDSDRTPEVDA